jgi:hypothetical protein
MQIIYGSEAGTEVPAGTLKRMLKNAPLRSRFCKEEHVEMNLDTAR